MSPLHSKQPADNRIKIIVAENNSLMRDALRINFEKEHDMEIIAETADGKEAVNLGLQLNPDILIIDEDIPLVNALEVTRQIKTNCTYTKVLLLTDRKSNLKAKEIINAGADGYILKTVEASIYIHSIRKIMTGIPQYHFAGGDFTDTDDPPSQIENNTSGHNQFKMCERELQILKCVSRGMQNRDIALKLKFGEQYVKTSLTTIYLKLGVSSRTEAVAAGLKHGIIKMDDLK